MKVSLQKRNKADLFVGLLLFVSSFIFLLTMHRFVYGGTQSAVGPLFFPRFIITIVVLLSFIQIVLAFIHPGTKQSRETTANSGSSQPKAPAEDEAETSNQNIVIYIGILFLYLAMLHWLGFMVSTPVIMTCVAYILNGRNFAVFIPMSVGFSVALYYIALKLMKIMLPMGVLFE